MSVEFTPPHMSHSSVNLWAGCSKRYELQKIQKVPEPPAWYLIAGTAVHTATEWLDRLDQSDPGMAWDCAFALGIEEARQAWPNEDEWLAGGWGAKKQTYDHWVVKGEQYVYQWFEKTRTMNRPVAIEADVSQTLPSGLLVKGFVDRVYHNQEYAFSLWDLKSGSKRPETDQQLGMYTVLWNQLNPDKPINVAGNYMFKDDTFYERDVSNWTLDMVDQIGQAWVRGVENRVFIPIRTNGCRTCSMRDACYAESGDTAVTQRFDTLHPEYRND